MKYGYRLVIHKDVPEEYMEEARAACQRFINRTCEIDTLSKKYVPIKPSPLRDGGWCNVHRRNAFGSTFTFPHLLGKYLVFRRLSNHRRIYGVVLKKDIVYQDGSEVESREYGYPRWSLKYKNYKYRMREPYKETEYITYAEIGDIKG